MASPVRPLAELRARIRGLERPAAQSRPVLRCGVGEIDGYLPQGGMAAGALHEIAGGVGDAAAAATLFVAGLLAPLPGPVLWCLGRRDLFAPGLAGVGLQPDRVIYAEAGDERTILLAMEEGLRHPALAGVVGELVRLPMTASRRLQLAAERSGVPAFVVRRRREAIGVGGRPGQPMAGDLDPDLPPTAALTRWRVTPLPSAPALAGLDQLIGRHHWRVELLRCRGAEAASWIVEACDAEGRLALPAELGDRSAASPADTVSRGNSRPSSAGSGADLAARRAG